MNIQEIFQQQAPAFKASRTDYLKQHHTAYHADADMLAVGEMSLIKARSRDLARNNETVSSASKRYVESLGAVSVKWVKSNGSIHTQTQKLWDSWTESCNSDGYGNFYTMQSVWHSERFESGEAITRFVIKGGELKLQQIGSEYLDITYFGQDLADNNRYKTRYGITFDGDKPIIYWFLPEHYFGYSQNTNFKRIPILAENILHIFERTMAGQYRGLPITTSSILNLLDTQDLIDSAIEKQRNAQAISWVIEQANAMTMNPVGLPTKLSENNLTDDQKKLVFKTVGNNVYYLNSGERINFHQANDIGANLGIMITKQHQRACSAMGVPYHQVTGDTMGLDFSSIRAILVDMKVRVEHQHHKITIPLGLKRICDKWQEITSITYPNIKNATPTFQLPRFYGVDDLKDAQSDLLEVQSGLSTLGEKLSERHLTYEDIIADRERIKELGIDIYQSTQSNQANQSANQTSNQLVGNAAPNNHSVG